MTVRPQQTIDQFDSFFLAQRGSLEFRWLEILQQLVPSVSLWTEDFDSVAGSQRDLPAYCRFVCPQLIPGFNSILGEGL